jgi:hypothetical protein
MPRSSASSRVRLVNPAITGVGDKTADGPAATDEQSRRYWLEAYCAVRDETERRSALLSAEDQVVQSMPDASPTKWHRAHVTWFFEQFLLRPFVKDYRPFDERFLIMSRPGRARRARNAV